MVGLGLDKWVWGGYQSNPFELHPCIKIWRNWLGKCCCRVYWKY